MKIAIIGAGNIGGTLGRSGQPRGMRFATGCALQRIQNTPRFFLRAGLIQFPKPYPPLMLSCCPCLGRRWLNSLRNTARRCRARF